jgi:hypothetical protein
MLCVYSASQCMHSKLLHQQEPNAVLFKELLARAKVAASSARTAAAAARQRDAQPFVQNMWQFYSTTATHIGTTGSSAKYGSKDQVQFVDTPIILYHYGANILIIEHHYNVYMSLLWILLIELLCYNG